MRKWSKIARIAAESPEPRGVGLENPTSLPHRPTPRGEDLQRKAG